MSIPSARLAIVAGLAILLTTSCPADELDKDWLLLNGRWRLVSWYEEGTQIDVQREPKIFVFDNGHVTCEYLDKEVVTLRMRLDSSTSPKSFDTWYDGDDPEVQKLYQRRVNHGIYEIDGDILRRCYALRGGPRPMEFKQGRKIPNGLMELERIKQ